MSLVQSLPESCTSAGLPTIAPRCNVLQRPTAADFRYVMGAARIAWPIKTAHALVAVTGASLRTCSYWLALKHAPSGRAAILLVRAVREQLQVRLRTLDEIGMSLE